MHRRAVTLGAMRRLLRVGRKGSAFFSTALLLIMSVSASAQLSRGVCGDPGQIVRGQDGWEAIRAPRFPSGEDGLSAYAVDSLDPRTILVTNGTSIMRSLDGGCDFDEVFELSPATTSLVGQDRIDQLVIPSSQGSWLALVTGAGPQVLSSSDGGTSWTDSSSGLPPVGTPLEIVDPPAAPGTFYLHIEVAGQSVVYETLDDGATWSPILSGIPEPDGVVLRLTDVGVEAGDTSTLWATSGQGVYRSTDKARTWERVFEARAPLDQISVEPSIGASVPRLFAFATTELVYVSDDRGATWTQLAAPGRVESSVQSTAAAMIAMDADQGEAYIYDPSGTGWRLVTGQRPPFYDLAADGEGTFYARTTEALMRYPVGTTSTPGPSESEAEREFCRKDFRFETPESAGIRPAELTPDGRSITLGVGESKTVRYDLDIDASPVPFDVFFLIDSSGSMADTACWLMKGLSDITRGLSIDVPNVRFGVAEYNDHPYFGERDSRACVTAYRLQQAVAPPSRSLLDAFARIRTCGRNETPLIALDEAAKGDGQDLLPNGESPNDLPPDQGAGFRNGGVRVLVHAADEAFQTYVDSPTRDQVIQTLREEGVYQVGLSGFPGNATEDLAAVARGTGAVAPFEGVDCDGDDETDIQEGEPLVCPIERGTRLKIIPMLLNIFSSFKLDGSVELSIEGGEDVVAALAPGIYPTIDFRADQLLDFSVTYRCGPEDMGKTFEVGLKAHSDGFVFDRASASISCETLVQPVDPAAPAAAGASFREPPPPAVPPIARVPQPNPQPNPQPQAQQQAQQQSQAQANPGVVAQRQQQPQAALVHAAQSMREQVSAQNAMVRLSYHRTDPTQAAKYGLAASTVALLMAFVFVRTRTAHSIERIRRPRKHG